MRNHALRPTPAELEILGVLWQRGPSTVREVHAALRPSRTTGYTTVLKLLQIMGEKGLVAREARAAQTQTQRQLVGDLLERAFGGSAESLVMHALAARKVSAEELTRIRALLDELEGGTR
jgi:predicted transcriptional regulator